MSRQAMVRKVNRNIYLMATTRYPWLFNMPTQWPLIVKFLEDYIPILSYKVVKWICPPEEIESVELCNILEVDVGAFKEGLQYCVNNNLMPLIMDTNSLILKENH
ncbi:hypothetical protein H5410_056609 [Solanum commersonii]|uniref:Uncharacterized protein n=1 Tax=Solanum commersonii TaxID=4109 RepID=A0A9J5WKQ9_SOLCO|nr:hypothetical protein H5410_056609 [Solanum commersonii]